MSVFLIRIKKIRKVKTTKEMKQESGRSMVEMLGVLAIIGVLSIGGIAGYTIAMNRWRANEIVDSMSKMAVIGMTRRDSVTWGDAMGTTAQLPQGVNAITAHTNGEVVVTFSPGLTEGLATALKSLGISAAAADATSLTLNMTNGINY